ncbi:MAG: histidine phosphatase family protein [Salinivirgaceae bacterium]|nr:histidine phosphatase family protein [Salinivirgaceae bacterium]
MKTLILMRHSTAEHGSSNIDDVNRKLTKHGVLVAQNQAVRLQSSLIPLDLILSSHAVRAFETASLVAKTYAYGKTLKQDSFLYLNYTTQDFIQWLIQQAGTTKSILVVGHNPEISSLAHRLSDGKTDAFQPGTIAILAIDINDWKDLEVGRTVEVTFLPSM